MRYIFFLHEQHIALVQTNYPTKSCHFGTYSLQLPRTNVHWDLTLQSWVILRGWEPLTDCALWECVCASCDNNSVRVILVCWVSVLRPLEQSRWRGRGKGANTSFTFTYNTMSCELNCYLFTEKYDVRKWEGSSCCKFNINVSFSNLIWQQNCSAKKTYPNPKMVVMSVCLGEYQH